MRLSFSEVENAHLDVEGRLVKPWVTWFIDVGTNSLCGTAITPGPLDGEHPGGAARSVRFAPLPPYTPHLKGTVETVNGAAGQMFFAGLPRYTGAQKLANGRPVDPDAPALTFDANTGEHLGAATLADQASSEQIGELRRCPTLGLMSGHPST